MAGLLRHRQTKGAATDRLDLREAESCSLLYPWLWRFSRRIGPLLRPCVEPKDRISEVSP